MLDTMKAWLMTYPGWEGTLTLDYAEGVPGSSGLYPRGLTEISRKEDVAGNVTVRLAWNFCLRRTAGRKEENARWLMAFQNWVMDQDRQGLAPKFGDGSQRERLRAYEGRLESQSQAGCAVYTVNITAEFTKFFRGET